MTTFFIHNIRWNVDYSPSGTLPSEITVTVPDDIDQSKLNVVLDKLVDAHDIDGVGHDGYEYAIASC